MEKAPEPSHARIGEELPSARWEYTKLILHKLLIYANIQSARRHSGCDRAPVPAFCLRSIGRPGPLLGLREGGRPDHGSKPAPMEAAVNRKVPP
jgi:hypothetical protein